MYDSNQETWICVIVLIYTQKYFNNLHFTWTAQISFLLFFVSVWHACVLTVAFQPPLSMVFSRQENWSGLPFPSPGDLPYPGIESVFPTLQVDSLSLSHLWILFSSAQLSHVWLWTAASQASLSIINFQSLCKLISTDSVMPSNHLILCLPLLLQPSILPSNPLQGLFK